MRKNKPTMIIPVEYYWAGQELNIVIHHKFDMLALDEDKKNNEWYKHEYSIQRDLNLLVSSDISQFNRDNLNHFEDVILRKGETFCSLKKLVSGYTGKKNIDDVINNYAKLKFERDDDYISYFAKRNMRILKSLFPELKYDLEVLYAVASRCENIFDLEMDDISLQEDKINLTIVQHDYEDAYAKEPLFKMSLVLQVDPDSEHIVLLPTAIKYILKNLGSVYSQLLEEEK